MRSLQGEVTGKLQDMTMRKVWLKELKRGKTKEQKAVLDFFLADLGCGCLNGGCFRHRIISMDEYGQMVSKRLAQLDLKTRAMEKIGLDESEIQEIPPIVVSGYCFTDDHSFIRIEDNLAVASRFAVSWLFFSQLQIYIYTYKFDMASDNTWENTKDFFYQDISSFEVEQRVVEHIDRYFGGCIRRKIETEKNNYLVDTIHITVPNNSFTCAMKNNGNLQQRLQAAKTMLREKKFVHQ